MPWRLPSASRPLVVPTARTVEAWVNDASPTTQASKRPRLDLGAASLADPPAAPGSRGRPSSSAAGAAAVSSATELARVGVEARARTAALANWALVVESLGDACGLGRRMISEGEPFCAASPSMVASFAGKATATLEKRFSAVRLFWRWLACSGAGALSFAEPEVFRYCQELHAEGAPARRAQACREAMGFITGTSECDLASTLGSQRLRGSALLSLRRRGLLRQRRPLTVDMVVALEKRVFEQPDEPDSLLAGSILFAIFGRTRVGDLFRSSTEPLVDKDLGPGTGFLEGALIEHKTARPGTKQAMPVVTPLLGVSGHPWAECWVAARARAGLDAATDGTLLAAPAASGGWTAVPLAT